jgi:hypothetical protein
MRERALIGFSIAVVMHLKNGWWLDASWRIREMLIVLGIAAVIVSVWKAREPAYKRAGALWVGFMVGVALILVVSGGSTLFPIVLVVAAGFSALAVLPGGLVGTVRDFVGH